MEVTVTEQLDSMINERLNRETRLASPPSHSINKQPDFDAASSNNHNAGTFSNTEITTNPENEPASEQENGQPFTEEPRDYDVTDDTWYQLQRDKTAADAGEKDYAQFVADENKQMETLRALKEEEDTIIEQIDMAYQKRDEDARICHEQAQMELELERGRQESLLAQARRIREAAEEQRQKEELAQKKLREMGVCVQGFRWIRQTRGYHCAGGSHWVSDTQLQL